MCACMNVVAYLIILTHTQTPWSTFRKVFLTDELIAFAVREFNYYPTSLKATRTRPTYIPQNQEWPPKWVYQTGVEGPLTLTEKDFLRNLAILYLLGVKGLASANIYDLFSNDPYLREDWLCKTTTRRDFTRFIRQVTLTLTPQPQT